jgi:hypothetical protein
MNYCLIISDGYINGFCQSEDAVLNPISEEEFNRIKSIHSERPTAQDGFTYKLKADTLEWELVELPEPSDTDDDATIEDYESALTDLGVNINGD